uniref:TIA1-like protein n=1 Tax=Dugesia japonica TaxID=6161 RepID=D5JG79_DUGJA|nr:TIA1-like protein [Dugesia japonica]
MWGDFMLLPNLYKPVDNSSSAVTATAIGLTTNPLLNPALCPNAANNIFAHPNHSLLPALQAMTSGMQLNKYKAFGEVNRYQTHTLTIPQLTLAPQTHAPINNISTQEDTSNHYHIFVGDIAPEIETQFLRERFSLFGRVTECKIIKDMHTQKPKGYGFVAYATKEEAEEALNKMNGKFLGTRQIRTNWAIRRPPQPPGKDQKPLDYNEVFAASSESNCTIYVGGITNGLCEELLRESFKEFGDILEVRIFKEKGYAFVRFDSHEGATQAIIRMHGKEVGSQLCKCSWGKESNDLKETSQNGILNPFSIYINPVGYPYSLLTQQIPDLNTTTNYNVSLSNLHNLTGPDFSGYMMSSVPNGLTNSNLGALNGLINQFSTARGMNS